MFEKIKFWKKKNPQKTEPQKVVLESAVDKTQFLYPNVFNAIDTENIQTNRRAVLTEWFFSAPYGQPRQVDILELRELARSPWVTMCVNAIIDEITSTPWAIVPKDEKNPNTANVDKVMEFFKRPNKNDESFVSILRKILRDILEIDAGVIVKVFGDRGKLEEIYAADGSSFLIDVDRYGNVKGYWQYSYAAPHSEPIKFDDREIVYIKANPRSYSVYGWSPIQSLREILKALVKSAEWNQKYFEQGAVPQGILSLIGMSETDFNRFKAYWNSQVRGAPYKVPIVGNDVKWIPLNLSNKDMQFLESQNWYLKLVMAMFKVPPSMLGFTEDVNRATAYEQGRTFTRKAILPLLRLLEYHINLEIVSELADDVEFKFNPSDPIEEQRQLEIWEKKLQMGLTTINDIRVNEMGLDPVPWGDKPFSLQNFTAPKPEMPMFDMRPENREPSSPNRKQEPELRNPQEDEKKKLLKPNFTKADRDVFYKLENPSQRQEDPRVITNIKALEHEFKTQIASVFEKHETELLEFLQKIKTGNTNMPEEKKIFEAIAQGNIEKSIIDELSRLVSRILTTQRSEFVLTMKNLVEKGIIAGGEKANNELHIGTTFELKDPDAIRAIEDYPEWLATNKYDDVANRIKEVIVDGLKNGYSIDDIAAGIHQEFNALKGWEAERIARTEVIRATNMGREIGYIQSGLVKGKQWVVTWDDRLCEYCRPMANQIVGLKQKFKSADFGYVDTPPLHPNCRCTIVPVLRDEVELINGGYVIKTKKMLQIEQKYKKPLSALLEKWYIEQGLGTDEIAAMTGVSKMTISNWLKQFKIPRRPKIGDPDFDSYHK